MNYGEEICILQDYKMKGHITCLIYNMGMVLQEFMQTIVNVETGEDTIVNSLSW